MQMVLQSFSTEPAATIYNSTEPTKSLEAGRWKAATFYEQQLNKFFFLQHIRVKNKKIILKSLI